MTDLPHLRAAGATSLQDSEERLRLALRAAAMGTFVWSIEEDRCDVGPQMRTLLGEPSEIATAADLAALIHPADRQRYADSVARACRLDDGGEMRADVRILLPGGGLRWLAITAQVSFEGEPRRASRMIGAVFDITERKKAEAVLRESEERARVALEAGRMGTWRYDLNSGAQQWDARQYALFGLEPSVTPDRDLFLSLVHPDDLELVAFDAASLPPEGSFLDSEFRIVRPDGEIRWITAHALARYDEDGKPFEIIGVNWDVTDGKRAVEALRESEERLQILVGELQHRTRNLVSVIQAVADRTLRSSATLGDFKSSFRERLAALGRVQGLLSRIKDNERVTFDQLLETELAAQASREGAGSRIAFDGPKGVRLRSGTVQIFALALHELTTNAAKYGALKQPNGRIAIRWRWQPSGEGGKPWLHVDWKESGVAMPPGDRAPQGGGQGRELIERALPYQFGARTHFALEPDGVHCAISLPVSEISAEEALNG